MRGIHSLVRHVTARFVARLATAGVVSVVLALGGLTSVARAAQAAPEHVWAYGQGGGAIVFADNFIPGAVVRVELLDAGLHTVLAEQYLRTPATGSFDLLMSTGFTGAVWVAADSPGAATVWATTYVFPAPHLDSIGGPCGTVAVAGSGFRPGATVRVRLLDAQLNVIDTQSVTAQVDPVYNGTIRATLASHGYAGTAYVEADDGTGPAAWGLAGACRT